MIVADLPPGIDRSQKHRARGDRFRNFPQAPAAVPGFAGVKSISRKTQMFPSWSRLETPCSISEMPQRSAFYPLSDTRIGLWTARNDRCQDNHNSSVEASDGFDHMGEQGACLANGQFCARQQNGRQAQERPT
ncbi:hypothetical protein [Azospirillum canadense]|uniref:hypothetical protein n=1 Tax=Azospirillum canadense TaxID=403962 RepID=UPI002227CA56|nr:hypothetical protein [Azospirillum canadense]MCW2237865.1 hypothetical protein [Azospirillum canadense]